VPAGGYFGQALLVDVTNGRNEILPLPEAILRAYLGGAGLGTWLLHRTGPPGVDPLGAAAPLAFVFSPLVGTPLTTSAKFAVVAKSPLTGMLTDALASSQFAIAGKLTGHDAIVISGRSERLSVLVVDGAGTRLIDAGGLAGLSAAEADRRLRDQLGRGWRVAAIGPAGERGVRYATISHDGRHAGRGGLGAVMGAKNLKAIAVRAAGKVATADPDAALAAARDLRARSFGPATAKYRELGTLANLLAFNAISTLPTRNFQAATFDGAQQLAAEAPADGPGGPADGSVAGMRRVARSSCASCTIGCEHIYRVGRGKKVRVEYENVFALGPMCGVSDPATKSGISERNPVPVRSSTPTRSCSRCKPGRPDARRGACRSSRTTRSASRPWSRRRRRSATC
jgi:aldehyde:ferredoxin oxidoreductase